MNRSWTIAFVAGLALGSSALATSPLSVGSLLVTEEIPGNVFDHNGLTGAYIQTFANVALPRALMGVHSGGPSGNVLVGSNGGGVREYDRNTGALLQTYNTSGGWQWAGRYKSNGNVLIGDMTTDDIREYDSTTGNLVGVFSPVVPDPADMIWGPNGNLFVCSFQGGVYELDGTTGALVGSWALGVGLANDIVIMPDGRRIVTSMVTNAAHVFDSSWNPITTFAGTGWGRVHGIDVSPLDGRIYVVDGVSQSVHVFDPLTYAELNTNFLATPTKPVDIEFVRAIPSPGALALAGAAVLLRRRRR
jgi:DNA-binding beta-propeller fold protein YncE